MAEIAADPQQRILRLENAIGDTNAASFNLDEHVRAVLEMIGDHDALKLHRSQK